MSVEEQRQKAEEPATVVGDRNTLDKDTSIAFAEYRPLVVAL